MKQVALIGCGNTGKRHAASIETIGKLTAVCDVKTERADEMATEHSATAYYSIDDLLSAENDVSLMVICTPSGFHAEHIIKALQAGKDVLTENPLCLTKAAAWQIIETQKFCRQQLFIVQSARYNPIIQTLKQQVKGEGLGKIYSFHLNCVWHRPNEYFVDWKGKLFPDGGLLYNQFSHYIDVMLWLFGGVAEAKGFVANAAHRSSVESEDTGSVGLQMESGGLGSLHWSVNAYEQNQEIALSFVAEKATVRIGGEYLNEIQYLKTNDELRLDSFEKDPSNFYQTMYNELSEVFRSETNAFPNSFDGLRTVETIEKIYKAVR